MVNALIIIYAIGMIAGYNYIKWCTRKRWPDLPRDWIDRLMSCLVAITWPIGILATWFVMGRETSKPPKWL